MSAELEPILVTAKRRNESIPDLIRSNKILQEKRLDRTMLIRALGLWYVRRGSVLQGYANIESAMELTSNRIPIVDISNHQSDSDHALKRIIFERNHYWRFANRILYLGGLKMKERKDVGFFTKSEDMLLIPTPFDIEEVDNALSLEGITEDERQVLSRLRRNYTNLSAKAIRVAGALRRKNKELRIGLYPESTRSRTGLVGNPRPQTSVWYRLEEGTHILPIAVEGGDYFHPPGAFPVKRVNARVIVGEPFPFEKIEHRAKAIPRSQQEQFIADYAFSLVVNMMSPKFIPPDKRAYYQQFKSL